MSDETKSELPEITDGEKQVLKDLAMKWLRFFFASGKWQGLVRHGLGALGVGAFLSVDDVSSKVASAALFAAPVAWSWLVSHYTAKKVAVLTKQADIVGTIDKLTDTLATLPNALPTVAEIKAAPTGETK